MSKKQLELKPNGNGKGGGFLHGNNGTQTDGGFGWAYINPALLAELIALVTDRGGAIRFGNSRDGQAGSIGIYYGDQRDTVYIRPSEDFEDATGVIRRYFETLPSTAGRSPSQGQ